MNNIRIQYDTTHQIYYVQYQQKDGTYRSYLKGGKPWSDAVSYKTLKAAQNFAQKKADFNKDVYKQDTTVSIA